MATKLLYLEDFDVITCDAKVLETHATDDGRAIIILDQTCFYPRGGGQDWDMGTINDFAVDEVRLDENGVVLHMGAAPANMTAGDVVHCAVDAQRRAINTRLHSGGHLLDMAITTLRPEWVPGKGAHFPHMSSVEYTTADQEIGDTLQAELQQQINQLLKSDYQNKAMFIPVSEMGQYCRHIPANLPTNKPSRIVLYADNFGIPCGGTHVRNVGEIGELTVTKIRLKKGIAKVSYAIAGIN